jgi:hypothetical protein
MIFKIKEKHLELKFSKKEIFWILIRGYFKLDKRSCYLFSNALCKIIAEMTDKYGDVKEHGKLDGKTFD